MIRRDRGLLGLSFNKDMAAFRFVHAFELLISESPPVLLPGLAHLREAGSGEQGAGSGKAGAGRRPRTGNFRGDEDGGQRTEDGGRSGEREGRGRASGPADRSWARCALNNYFRKRMQDWNPHSMGLVSNGASSSSASGGLKSFCSKYDVHLYRGARVSAIQDIGELYVIKPVFLSDVMLLLRFSASVSLFLYASVFVKRLAFPSSL